MSEPKQVEFVDRAPMVSFTSHEKRLVETIEEALRHGGFSVIRGGAKLRLSRIGYDDAVMVITEFRNWSD